MNLRTFSFVVVLFGTAWISWSNPAAPGPYKDRQAPLADAAAPKVQVKIAAKASAVKTVGVLRVRSELLGGAGEHGDAALFRMHSWTPPPPPVAAPKVVAPSKPVAPPIPFSYLGKKFENGVWEAYLARGSETYVVRDQTLIDGIYRAETVRPPILTLLYLPLKQIQTLTIGEAQ